MLSTPILFCALDDHKIHVFAGDEYHRVHTLVGHEDWVRGMDVLEVGKCNDVPTYVYFWNFIKYKLIKSHFYLLKK